MAQGWIKLHRKVCDCWIWQDREPFDKRSAWVDLLLSANHSDKKILSDGELITVKRGQILTSIRNLSMKWKWSVNKVYRYIKLLENDGMLHKESNKDRTLLTIVNYDIYQCLKYTNENSDEYTSETPAETVTNNKQECKEYKNDKECTKNERKEHFDDPALNEAFLGYIDMRKQIKKPMTDRAVNLAIKKLHELADVPFSDELNVELAIEILNQSILNGWQGLFPIEADKRTGNASKSISEFWKNA